MSSELFGFDANLMFLFTEVPLDERPAAAAASGFSAIELWWPFAGPTPPSADVDRLAGRIVDAGTSLVCLNLYSGDMAAGDRGVVSVPAAAPAFRASLDAALALASATGCRRFNAPYGNRLSGLAPQEQDEMALANLVEASNAVDELGGTLLLEVLNPVENPDYPLNSTGDALGVRHRALEAGAARVELLIDLYHFARIGQPPAYVLAEAAGAMGHVQVADAPGRNEPGSGTLGVDGLFRPLAEAGWDGWVGLEYRPRTGTKDSLAWLGTEKRRRRPTRCA